MLGILALGLLLGLQHALEADHLAAVASLSTRNSKLSEAARHGAVWGIGHGLTLLAFGGALLLIDLTLVQWAADALELAVGLMLVALGADVLLRAWRQRVHFHVHRHGQRQHFHAHSHADASTGEHANDPHRHSHPSGWPVRALFVGMMHGLAGTAALLVFALGTVDSVTQGLLYILVFGLGSVIGMSALAVIVSLPLRWSADRLGWAHKGLTAVLGLVSVTLGLLIAERSGVALIQALPTA
jgi:ABC-type nickel/cobalt efflux system permease component RcnA